MRNIYKKYLTQSAKGLLVLVMSFFALMASAQTFSIDSVSEDAASYYPYESVDVFFFSENNEWPSDSTYYYFIDLDGDGEYDSDDHLLASGSDTTLEATLPNIPGNYNLHVMSGNGGSVGDDLNRNYGFSTSTTGTLSGVFPFDLDQASDREVFINTDDYDDGNSYTLFIDLEAPNVTSTNPIVVEYSTDAGATYTSLSDVEGETSFSAFDDSTFVFSLPSGALAADVLIRISQENAASLAADEEDWIVSDITIQTTDGTLIEYGITAARNITILNPTISLGGDSLSVYVGEDIGVSYESFGYTTGATFYLFTGDIEDPDDRVIYGSSTTLEDSITGTWGYDLNDVDLQIAGYYGNIDNPEFDLSGDTLTVSGSDESDYTFYFDQAGIRSATTPSLDVDDEEYATLELGLESNGAFSTANALLIQYNVGSGWVTIDSLYGSFDDNFEYEVTSSMQTTSTMFRVRQANTTNSASSNTWWLSNFDVTLHELQNTTGIVSNLGSYPLNYSITVEDIFEVTEDDDTVSITSAYPGDKILVHASVAGFDADADSLNFAVIIDGTYLLEDVSVNIDAEADSVLIVGTLPLEIEYETNLGVQVKLASGSTPIIGLNVDVFTDYDAEEEDSEISYMGGEYDSGAKSITFEEAGDRWVTTPGINIPTTTGLTMEFTIQRTGARSPSGTEVVLEYSTDGGDNYSTLDTYSINAGGSSGTSYELEGTDLTGVVSTSTLFRFRQLTNNGADLDGWKLSGIVFTNGTNILSYDYLDINGDLLDIDAPVITLESFDDAEDYYPGEDLSVTFSIEGEFPSGTEFMLQIDNEIPLVFGEFTAAGTHTVKVPAVVEAVYSNIKIVADYQDVESNAVALTVNAVQINDITITSSESTTDGDFEFIYPGNEITVAYTTLGEIGEDVLAYLEVYNGNESAYVILEDSMTVGDDITTTLPAGYDYSGGPDFRLTLKDMSGNLVYTSDDVTWGFDTSLSNERFPLSDRLGHNNGNNFFYNNSTTRSATSIPYDFRKGGRVDFDIQLYSTIYYDQDQSIYLQYSTDGEAWNELAEGTIENTTADIFPDAIEIPEEAWMDSVYLRFIYNEDGLVSGTDNIVYFYGFEINYYESEPIAEEVFDLSDVSDLTLENLSLSLALLEDTEFNLGEEFTVQYNADGPFGDVDFAIVMEETVSNTYKVLAESDQTGAVELTVSAPEIPFGDDTSPSYRLAVYPFEKVSETDSYRAAAETENLTSEDDFIIVSGSDDTTPMFTFDEDGERYLVTRAIDFENYEYATLNFTANVDENIATIATVPVLEASTDGETFELIPVTGATYEDQGYVYPDMAYNVEIPEEYLVSEVWFRWSQPLNGGAGNHVWTITNVSVSKGETNLFDTDAYTPYNIPQTVTLNSPDLSNYVWEKADSMDAVFNGEDFEFTWGIDSADIDETTFPEGTMFIFTLDGVTDPDTGEELVLASGTTYGTYTGTIPFYVENDAYDINIIAYSTYTNDDGDEEDYYFFEGDQIPSASLDVFLRVVRTTVEFNENDVLYAGNSATFSITQENDESNDNGLDDLYASLLAVDIDGTDDMILATQLGSADITIDLPPFLSGSQTFLTVFSEDAPVGSVGDIGEFEFDEIDSNSEDITSDADNFLSGDLFPVLMTKVFDASDVIDSDAQIYYQFTNSGSTTVYFEYSIDGGDWLLQETEFGGGFEVGSKSNIDLTGGSTIQFRWIFDEPNDGTIDISYLRWYDGDSYIYNLEDDLEYLPTGNILAPGVSFEASNGRGLITTRDFTSEELEGKTLVNFDLTFDEISENMVSNQYLIFEYSTDGGATYSELASFPETDAEETIDEETFRYELTDAMLNDGVRFRFRQEERDEIDVAIVNFMFEAGKSLPFGYISDDQSITKQQVLVTDVSVDEICQSAEVQLTYEIRGRFGADNILKPVYKAVGGTSSVLSGYEFEATDGTGTVSIQLPNTLLSAGADNGFYRFALNADDNTDMYEDINEDVDVTGQFSEANVELVAPINTGATFTVSDDILECSPGEVLTATISGVQNYFMYEIYNVETEAVVATLTYDPDVDETEVELGTFTEAFELDMRITSMSSSGDLTCKTKETTAGPVEVEYLETFKLFVYGYQRDEYVEVEAGFSKTICEDAASGITLRTYRNDEFSGDPTMIEWFKDDLNTNISSATSVGGSTLSEPGNYFARITDGTGCTYLTESFEILNVDKPEVPVITVVSGSLGTCENEDGEVLLEAPAGYAYYRWYEDSEGLLYEGQSNQFTAEEEGDYYVEVSNLAFSNSCSEASEMVELRIIPVIEFVLYDDDIQEDYLYEGEVVNACGDFTLDFVQSYTNTASRSAGSGLYQIFKDGVLYKSVTGSSVDIEESGEYFVEWTNDELNSVCTTVSPTITVNITDPVEEIPVITVVSGDLLVCEDAAEVTLSAPDGFAYYEWAGGSIDGVGTQTVTVDVADSYSVRVSNVPFGMGCSSAYSDPVAVKEVYLPEFFVKTTSGVTIEPGSEINSCSDYTVRFYDNTSWVNAGQVNVFLDGTLYSTTESRQFTITESGSYTFEWVNDDPRLSCTVSYEAFTVTVADTPEEAPLLTYAGDLTFCQGEGSVTLTAPAGFDYYEWSGASLNTQSGFVSNNEIVVSAPGTYSVKVGFTFNDGSVCLSPVSNSVTLNSVSLPTVPTAVTVVNRGCGESGVTFRLDNNVSSNYVYQLVEAATGIPSGNPVPGVTNSNTFITSGPITEGTYFYLEVSLIDGSGCSNSYPDNSSYLEYGAPNNVTLELNGLSLTANISGVQSEIRWYRNDVEMVNRLNNSVITVMDDATYMVEVDYPGGCTVTSNAIDLSSGRATPSLETEQIVASTYPNPTTNVVNLDIPGEDLGTVTIKIFSLTGQLLMSDSFEKNVEQFIQPIDISGLDAGVYNMTVSQGNRVENIRIVKK